MCCFSLSVYWRLGWSRSECITVAQLRTLRFWPATYIKLDDNNLHCVHTAEATTRPHSICSCAVRLACKHAPPLTTPTHDAWWASWRRLGRWHVPPTGNERERERERERAQTSTEKWIRISDFGTPGSGRWSGSSPKLNSLVPGPCPTPSKKFRQNPFTTFSVIWWTDRQTEVKTTSFGRGNNG